MRPRGVDLHVELDPATGSRVRGEVAFDLELAGRRRRIELHAVDLRLSRARLRVGDRTWRARIELHPERETAAIVFDRPVPAGTARLELAFAGRLRTDLTGLYAVETRGLRYAFSQLAPTSARRFFPCFDEPDAKARFALRVTTDAAHQVLSNSPVERRELHDDGRQTVWFERTPPLSTYLLALAVGPLERSAGSFCGSTEIRVWHVPGKAGLADFALEAARESLLRLEAWFDLPYPYAKLDLVAVPDFEFGAMENPGAVFFRETLLLLDPKTATLAERERAAEVIAHELSHMWYGNLVTMAWWDDLWLNEAFATWMAFEIVDRWRPDWRMWQVFLAHRAAALEMDALAHTHPVYTPVRRAEEVGQNFDVITYEKGAAVLRMIERFLGPEIFCAGVRRYVRVHREGNAVAADLWRSLTEVSGSDVEPVVRAWIEQEGHPVLTVRRAERDGIDVVELRQERFLERPPARRAAGRRPVWPIPFLGRVGNPLDGTTRVIRHLMTKTRAVVPAEGAEIGFVYGNADEACFLRPEHDPRDFEDLLQDLSSLSEVERTGFVDHQWALVRAGRAPMAQLLDLLAAVGADGDPDVLAAARRPLATLARRLAPDLSDDVEARLRAWIEVYYGGQVDALGWEPAPGEDERTGQRRAVVLEIAGAIGRASVLLEAARERVDAYLEDRSAVAPEVADAVVRMAAIHGDAALHDRYLHAVRDARTPQEQRRFLLGLADFEDPEGVRRTLAGVSAGGIANQDVPFVLERLLQNRAARAAAWQFVRRHWTRLEHRMGAHSLARVIRATPALATRAARREVAAFFRAHPHPAGGRALRQALERFDWYDAYRRRAGPELVAYLTGSTTDGTES